MKIIYSGVKYNYYNPQAGPSFEHVNFYESLKEMNEMEIVYFPFDRILEIGRERWNQELQSLIKREKPDLFFAFLFTDELMPAALEEIKKTTTSLAWFADDHWRFHNYSKFYAPHFTWVVTTYSRAIELYQKIGIKNVIRSQWAANTKIYRPTTRKELEVSFVGGWSKPRQKIISALSQAGLNVSVYGSGWPNGRVSEEEMIRIFSQSKINLGLNPAPGYFNKNSLGRLLFRRSVLKIVPDWHLWSNFQCWLNRGIPQIKARHFEIPACGGFLITSLADDLESFYKPGEEIIIYNDLADLIGKIKYYLIHEDARRKIARAGYGRTIAEHTYEKRLLNIFRTIGLSI